VRGRFSREVGLPVPDAPARSKILQLMTASMRLSPAVDFRVLGKMTPGFVGADLQSLAREAGMTAVSRIVKSSGDTVDGAVPPSAVGVHNVDAAESAVEAAVDHMHLDTPADAEMQVEATHMEDGHASAKLAPIMQNAWVEMSDFTQAAKSIQPTAKREGFAVAPDVTWSDVGALAQVREELLHNVLEPISHPERFQHLGLEVPAGVLFFGPPGCGKTLLAKALANQSGANFISVKGPELLSMYVGESESKVRQVFARARASAPCVIFFDELDALCPKRGNGFEGGGGAGGGSNVSDRVVNQLLTELDGLETRRDVYIIAATNRLELIDDAMLRPGRLGKLLYVPLPTDDDRISILQALTKKVSIQWRSEQSPEGVDLVSVAKDPRAAGFSGADLSALVREAGLAVVREMVNQAKDRAVSHSGAAMVTSEDIIGRPYVSSTDLKALASSETAVAVLPASQGALSATGAQSETSELRSILARHFEAAFGKVRASVSTKDRKR
jgi:ribosome biogenesis ATPase